MDGLLLIVEFVPVLGLLFLALVFPLVMVLEFVPDLFVRFRFLEEEVGVGLFVGEETAGFVVAFGVYTLGVVIVEEDVLVVVGFDRFDCDVEVLVFLVSSGLSVTFFEESTFGVLRVVDVFFSSFEGSLLSFLLLIDR